MAQERLVLSTSVSTEHGTRETGEGSNVNGTGAAFGSWAERGAGVWLTYKTLVGPQNSDGTLTREGRALITMGPVRWEPLVAHGTCGLLQL